MAASWRVGSLVMVTGVDEVAGSQGQIVALDDEAQECHIITFGGIRATVGLQDISPLPGEALGSLDFVVGSTCDAEALGQGVVEELALKGYAVSRLLADQADVSRIHKAVEELKFDRVPSALEPYYLGRESREKMALIDLSSEDVPQVVRSALDAPDARMNALLELLAPGLDQHLGVRVASRTRLMVRQTFASVEEEARYPSPTATSSAEKEAFVSVIKRRRVCLMHFLGPLAGVLTLIPKGAECADDVEIEGEPGVMVIFLTEMFHYSHCCAGGAALSLQSWLLARPPEFRLGDIGGDMEVLGVPLRGPKGPQGETVAVNGVSTCLGGDAKDHLCYWLMFAKAGADTFIEVPALRWDCDVYCYMWDVHTAQLTRASYTNHQGYVEGIEFFDAGFFGIGTKEVAAMDPNQRKVLEVVYEALNMGGYDMETLQRNPAQVGCFIGVSGSEWGMVEHPQDTAGLGMHDAIVSGRCNFLMNLKGASQTINTACSAGLVAAHAAKLHLKYRDFDPLVGVVAAGINLAYSPHAFIGACSGAMLSYKGRSFTFDVGADGYGRGEGASAVFMNLAQYSPGVFALVAGSQSNQDGRSASITAPNGPSQEKCIRAALREAGLSPGEVDCFECHGTGTALGDPIEVGALRRIYAGGDRERALVCTSSKTNLGHLEGGAGMAGFVKCCLQVMRAECGPNLHLRQSNPHLNVEGFPCRFVTEGLACQYDGSYSGVSSFGFGGTNAHAMAYGRNSVTSRGITQRDLRSAVRERIRRAPPPDVGALEGEPEGWEWGGMPICEEKVGKIFQVEMLEDSSVVWREMVDAQPAHRGTRFCLSGTFNLWGATALEPSAGVPGLHVGDIFMPIETEVVFRVVADDDPRLTYFPVEPRSTRRTVPMAGPSPPPPELGEDAGWLMRGRPGERFRVEFHCSDESTSVIHHARATQVLQAWRPLNGRPADVV